MSYYSFLLRHDRGYSVIKTSASSLHSAIRKIMIAEKCPKRAITFLKAEAINPPSLLVI